MDTESLMADADAPRPGRILVADDEPEPLRATARILRYEGYEVITADSGDRAAAAIAEMDFDVIVSDISMPGMTGIELLQFVRKHDAEIPVVLITGAPAVETAVQALDHGAYKYLMKPVKPKHLEEVVKQAVRMRRMARLRREAAELGAAVDPNLKESFKSAMESLWMAYQPIVTRSGELFGYEALLRTEEPSLSHPEAVIDAAQQLRRMNDLGRLVRQLAAEPMLHDTSSAALFVNLHPNDLEDDTLIDADAKLSTIASRVVLEVTERASVRSVKNLRKRVLQLRELGFRIAVDDLGAGYAGLTSFALLEPEIVKVDMSLVRDVDTSPVKQRLFASITSLCKEMNITVVGEGVETLAERDTLLELGCDLFQGYYISKPNKPFPPIRW